MSDRHNNNFSHAIIQCQYLLTARYNINYSTKFTGFRTGGKDLSYQELLKSL